MNAGLKSLILGRRVSGETSVRQVAYRLIFEGPFAQFAVNCWRPRSRPIIAKHGPVVAPLAQRDQQRDSRVHWRNSHSSGAHWSR